jgi:hypothetical protein
MLNEIQANGKKNELHHFRDAMMEKGNAYPNGRKEYHVARRDTSFLYTVDKQNVSPPHTQKKRSANAHTLNGM